MAFMLGGLYATYKLGQLFNSAADAIVDAGAFIHSTMAKPAELSAASAAEAQHQQDERDRQAYHERADAIRAKYSGGLRP